MALRRLDVGGWPFYFRLIERFLKFWCVGRCPNGTHFRSCQALVQFFLLFLEWFRPEADTSFAGCVSNRIELNRVQKAGGRHIFQGSVVSASGLIFGELSGGSRHRQFLCRPPALK